MSSNIFSITTGDLDGIGYEVTVKALVKNRLKKNQKLIIWRSPQIIKKYSRLLQTCYSTVQLTDVSEAIDFLSSNKKTSLVELVSDENPAHWVERSAQLCIEKKFLAIITGPLSKTTIKEAGFSDMGHTGILSRIAKTESVYMTFLGKFFNVLCVTGHIPMADVEKQLTDNRLSRAIELALKFKKNLPSTFSKKPLGLLGLNPHASENGLIGDFDLKLQTLIKKLPPCKDLVGPLVPDAAFLKSNWNRYSLFISLYHDQGLIPFKLVHGQDSGTHFTLGLPFVRTSVDHGTAKDIYKKDMANCNSMADAISWAIHLTRN
jgi:4-hydroxythreonine-4-phosphate dehydrogenase